MQYGRSNCPTGEAHCARRATSYEHAQRASRPILYKARQTHRSFRECSEDKFDMTTHGELSADSPISNHQTSFPEQDQTFSISIRPPSCGKMSTPREGPNPLRPYYIPPSVGDPLDFQPNASAAKHGSKHASTSTDSFGSSTRNILADMDYSDYISDSGTSPTEAMKGLIEKALWRYFSVFLAQPFDVSKTILQVQLARTGQKPVSRFREEDEMRRRPGNSRRESYHV